jgi:hypothetical protein
MKSFSQKNFQLIKNQTQKKWKPSQRMETFQDSIWSEFTPLGSFQFFQTFQQ